MAGFAAGVFITRQKASTATSCGQRRFLVYFIPPPPQWGGLDLNSSNRGCARLGGEVDPRLGVVVEEVAVLVVLVRRQRRAVRIISIVRFNPTVLTGSM